MSVEPGIVDANVLAYAARDTGVSLYVTSQILCELYSVLTNPRRVNVASSSAEALRVISALLALPGLHVLPIPARAVEGWMSWPTTCNASTFNCGDFDLFPELTVVKP